MNKQQAQEIIRNTFESSFDKNSFIGFIKNLLNRIDEAPFIYQGNYIPDAYKKYIKSLERIGKFSDGENNIDILVITLQKETSLERARTMQRNFVAWYLNGSRGGEMKDAALAAFISPDEEDWRFSLVKMDYKFDKTQTGKIKVKEEFTPARRWSFLVGANEKSHTAQSRLVNILANDEQSPILKEIENAFDIETVTKEFFLKYRDLFLRTKEELDRVVKKDPKIKSDFESKVVDTVNFAKKLLGQIVFLYFLQKKGWFGVGRDDDWGTGSKHFIRKLFEKRHGSYTNFFNDILEPLFYDALRNDRSHDDHYYSRFDCKIPFLNGGLFDPIGNYDWVHSDICLPDYLFSNKVRTKEGDIGDGILDVFDRYNFTVREDEPLEKEVAIDPELLGKVYEKFNAIRPDNFEEYQNTLKGGKKGEESKFNKQYGVYYTPREIVHYMCQQSLINYLHTELNSGASSYQKVGDIQTDAFGNKVKSGQLDLTIEHPSTPLIAIEDIETLIHFGEQVSENEVRVLNEGRETKTYFYKLPESIRVNAGLIDSKLEEITVCDPAVGSGAFPLGMMNEIVKARTVLTNFIKTKTNRTPYDFKRRCIEHSLYGVDIDPGAVEIAKLRLWLSLVVDEEDIRHIKPLPNLDYKIVCGNSLLGVEKNLFNNQLFVELEKLKPLHFNETNPTKKQEYKNQIDDLISQITNGHKEFDFEVYFSEVFHYKEGFDVVIGNPPYGHIFQENEKKELRKLFPELQFKIDSYSVFILKAIYIQNPNSYCTYIVPSTLMDNYFEEKVRIKLLTQNKLDIIIELDDQIFESAVVHSMILGFFKSLKPTNNNIKCSYSHALDKDFTLIPSQFFLKQDRASWLLRNYQNRYLIEKLSYNSKRLIEVLDIRQAIKTGNDDKYISNEKKNADYKPVLGGKHIEKWLIKDPKLYVFYGDHLACPRDYKIFEQPKILIREAGNEIIATYDDSNFYILSSLYNAILKDKSFNLKYCLGLINSGLFKYLMSILTFSKTKGAFTKAKIFHYYGLPIKISNKNTQTLISNLVDRIFSLTQSKNYKQNPVKQARVKKYEKQIDQKLYKLYGLTKEEIAIIEKEEK